jgi:hypothetical protein
MKYFFKKRRKCGRQIAQHTDSEYEFVIDGERLLRMRD